MSTLTNLQYGIGTWGEKVFGVGDPLAIIKHMRDEVEELDDAQIDAPNILTYKQMEEAADIAILLLQYAHRKGFDLGKMIEEKHTINLARKWGPPDERGVVRHVEASDD